MTKNGNMHVVAVVLKFVVNDQVAGVHRKGAEGGPPSIAKILRLLGILGPTISDAKEFHGFGVAQQDTHGRFPSVCAHGTFPSFWTANGRHGIEGKSGFRLLAIGGGEKVRILPWMKTVAPVVFNR